MRQWMSRCPISHQIGAVVAALLAFAAPCPAQLQVAPMALPSGLCLPAPHPTPLRLSAALAASPQEAKHPFPILGPLARETELLLSFQTSSESQAPLCPIPTCKLPGAA